jgi:hypothetical protein
VILSTVENLRECKSAVIDHFNEAQDS